MQIITGNLTSDLRGQFQKHYLSEHEQYDFPVGEFFTTKSSRGVMRGMHLQTGSYANRRIISVVEGTIFDVLIDLRPTSPTFLKTQVIEMSQKNRLTLVIPEGVAHGYQSLTSSTVSYISSKIYQPIHDVGIDCLSFGIQWPLIDSIRSTRDLGLPTLEQWLDQRGER